MSYITIKNISVGYTKHESVLRNISLRCNSNGLYRLTGENGTGKSTLFETLAGFLPLQQGSITVNNDSRSASRIQEVTLLRHHPALVPYMCVSDNIALFTRRYGSSTQSAFALASQFNLDSYLDVLPHELSTGTMRKVWLVCGLQSTRPLLLLDEPWNGLDAQSSALLLQTLLAHAQHQIIMVISHILPQCAEARALTTIESKSGPFALEQLTHQSALSNCS